MARRFGGIDYTSREGGYEPIIHPSSINFLDAHIDCINQVTIDRDVFSGHDVTILTGSHDPTVFGPARKVTTGGGPVHIKEGAWICSKAIIIGPVTIGRHAVVAAGAVVVDDVPDFALVAGVPARIKKFYTPGGYIDPTDPDDDTAGWAGA